LLLEKLAVIHPSSTGARKVALRLAAPFDGLRASSLRAIRLGLSDVQRQER